MSEIARVWGKEYATERAKRARGYIKGGKPFWKNVRIVKSGKVSSGISEYIIKGTKR